MVGVSIPALTPFLNNGEQGIDFQTALDRQILQHGCFVRTNLAGRVQSWERPPSRWDFVATVNDGRLAATVYLANCNRAYRRPCWASVVTSRRGMFAP